MNRKRLFQPGDLVSAFTGQVGVVLSADDLQKIRDRFREGKRPGHFFAPGCCHNPDFVTQVPVFFEDGTFDVMRAMNVKKRPDFPEETRANLYDMMGLE
jgi:hypothetical protein